MTTEILEIKKNSLSACKRNILVQIPTEYLLKSDIEKFKHKKPKENVMNYFEATQLAKQGKRVRREAWNKGEFMWSDAKILIHNTPYWTNEKINQSLNGYPYVCEQVDVVANDWHTCNDVKE